MPKSKKNTRKASSSRLHRITNLLKPNSPKKGLLLFAVVFALAGGGYAVYKSHAQSWTVYPNDFSYEAGAYKKTDCNGNKGCITVADIPFTWGITTKIYTHFSSATNVSLCMVVRAQVSSSKGTPRAVIESSIDSPPADINLVSYASMLIPKSTTYREYCAYGVPVPGGTHNLFTNIGDANTSSSPVSDLYISSVTMKW